MEIPFWQARWREGKIGFHQPEVNRHLVRHLPALVGERVCEVLVPLCGKSVDLLWLREQGQRVTGVEAVTEACEALFAEHAFTPEVDALGPFRRWQVPALTVLEGDFFQLDPGRGDLPGLEVPAFELAWDRAALVALPPAMRPRYAAHLRALLRPARGHLLLVTLDYDPGQMEGPPFAVPDSEVQRLFPGCELLHEESRDAEGAERFGLTWLTERVYRG